MAALAEDEELPKKKEAKYHPEMLEPMSIQELQEYIDWLKTEINRASSEIAKKKSAQAAADSFFKKEKPE